MKRVSYFHQTTYVAEMYIRLINKLTNDYTRCFGPLSMMMGRMMGEGFDFDRFFHMQEAWEKDHSSPDPQNYIEQYGMWQEIRKHIPTVAMVVSSRAVISGDLLQLAKQTLSFRYGAVENWPAGRAIGHETLASLILNGRNHSFHFEGKPHKQTADFLEGLVRQYGKGFPLPTWAPRNMGYELISLLEWTSYSQYEADLRSLLVT